MKSFVVVVALVVSIGLGSVSALAAPNVPQNPIDVPFYSQFDPRWGNFLVGYNEDVTMRSMGSLLTCVAMVAASYGMEPKFVVPGTGPDLLATPDYIHAYLKLTAGYRPSPAKTVIMDYDALGIAFFTFPDVPSGLRLFPWSWPTARFFVDDDLEIGRPSILFMQPAPNRFHPLVVVGWDADSASYLVLDPARPRWSGVPVSIRGMYGSGWEAMISGALVASPWTAQDVPLPPVDPGPDEDIPLGPLVPDLPIYPLVSVSTKSPVETVGVDPDGRKVGYDVATGTVVTDVAGSSYLPQPVWADPTGVLPTRPPGRLLTIPHAVSGRYRFQMIATGDGPFTLSVRARNAGGDLVVNESVTGTVTTGQVLKFQVEYSSNGGPSGFTVGDNFKPEANAGGARLVAVNATVPFDGGASFDIDGTIAAYQWDFGDGSTATGPTASHTYATPGLYTATLTVTDDLGATATDTATVTVFGNQATAGTTERVSVATGGAQAIGTFGSFNPALSADGRFVAFDSFTNNLGSAGRGILVRDRQAGTTESVGDPSCPGSRLPDISADGRFVAFECDQQAQSDTTPRIAILVRDRVTGLLERADVSSAGQAAACDGSVEGCASVRPAISADGRFVAFYSGAINLVPGDTNANPDVFVRDRVAGTTERVSVPTGGAQSAWGAASRFEDRLGISANGRFVAFASVADDLVPGGLVLGVNRIFVRDRQLGTTELASLSGTGAPANSDSRQPSISADGRVVAFSSFGNNLVPGDTNNAEDVFVRDRVAGTTERVNITGAGTQVVCPPAVTGAECNRDPVVSADGRFVVFRSRANNLILNDTNLREDVFIRDRQAGTTEIVSLSTDGVQGNGSSGEALFTNDPTRMAVSRDGRFVAFVSDATNLVAFDTNNIEDVFVRDRQPVGPVAAPSGPYLGWASTASRPAYVAFDASGSLDPAGRPLVGQWNFGDGSPVATGDAGTSLAHAYAAPGLYTVTLVVSNGTQTSAPVATLVEILPPLAPALRMMPACGRPGDQVAVAVDGYPLVSAAGGWDLGRAPLPAVRAVHPAGNARVNVIGPIGDDLADQVVPIQSFTSVSALEFSTRFAFTVGAGWAPGTFTVSTPEESNASGGFTVPCPALANEPPRASVGGPYQGTVGVPVVFDGSASADPEGAPLTLSWFFEDGGTATGPRPSHTFQAPGTYYVGLVVSDGVLESPTSVGTNSYTTVTIVAAPPTPPPPPVPTPKRTIYNLAARAKDSKVDLTWTCVKSAASYNIYRSATAGGTPVLIKSGFVATRGCVVEDVGLTNGKKYYYTVTSVDAQGHESLPSNQASATPTAAHHSGDSCLVGHGSPGGFDARGSSLTIR
jgi:PKD repeat protein